MLRVKSVQGLYLEVEEGAQHGLAHPLLLGRALVEGGGVLLAGATEGVAVPSIDAACRGRHVVAVGLSEVAAPVLQNTQPVLQIGQVDAGTEERSLGCHIPA